MLWSAARAGLYCRGLVAPLARRALALPVVGVQVGPARSVAREAPAADRLTAWYSGRGWCFKTFGSSCYVFRF